MTIVQVQVENNIERELRVYRGIVLKQDLKNAVQAPSMKELRRDIEKFCTGNREASQKYVGFEHKHHVTIEFAQMLIGHLFLSCKIILIT
jgi:hypothetical protein